MKILSLVLLFVWVNCSLFAQEMSGDELLVKTIQFHDPSGNWETLKAKYYFDITRPNGSSRTREVSIKNDEGSFEMVQKQDGNEIIKRYTGQDCFISFNGATNFDDATKEEHRLTCDNTMRMRDYYTYLYGLPMKLKDPGTIIHEKIKRATFQGKNYLELRVTYEENVGSDIWYFYFNPENYAMEGYKFYHDETAGDGEYIILEEMMDVDGIQTPKVRHWYLNQGDKFLGTDDLVKVESLD